MVLLGLIFSGALFFRWLLFIIPFEQRDFILYSILLTIIGSVIYVLSAMTAAELKGVWYYILVVLSAQGLVFAVSPWTVLVLQNWVIPFLLRKKAPTGK